MRDDGRNRVESFELAAGQEFCVPTCYAARGYSATMDEVLK